MRAICVFCSWRVDDIVVGADEAESYNYDRGEDEGEDDGGVKGSCAELLVISAFSLRFKHNTANIPGFQRERISGREIHCPCSLHSSRCQYWGKD